MQELGVDFDDDLFEETKQKNTGMSQEPYSVKICEPQWYDDPTVNEPGDMHSIYKYRGDSAFYRGQYQEALENYDQCLDNVFSTNIPMWKDVQEARARCYIHIKDKVKATELAQELVSQATNYDQKTSSLHLLACVSETFQQQNDELCTIQALLTLHSSNPDLWLRLARIYNSLNHLDKSGQGQLKLKVEHQVDGDYKPSKSVEHKTVDLQDCDIRGCSDGLLTCSSTCLSGSEVTRCVPMEVAMATCLIRARSLLRNVRNSIDSFAKDRNIRSEEIINEELKQCNISEQLQQMCIQFLYHNKEDDEDSGHVDSDIYKLEMLQKLTRESFECNWFSWYSEVSKETCSST